MRPRLFHFRTQANQEVDFVLEDPAGRLVGVEVKALDTVSSSDFKGLRALAEAVRDRFVRGVVLYWFRHRTIRSRYVRSTAEVPVGKARIALSGSLPVQR